MNNSESSRLNNQIEILREAMHRAGRPGGPANREMQKISCQLDQLILIAMKQHLKSGRPGRKLSHTPSEG